MHSEKFFLIEMSFIKNILLLILSPKVGWEEIGRYHVSTQILTARLLYPMLAILSASVFVRYFYDVPAPTVSLMLERAIISFSSYFCAFYVASYVLTGFFQTIAHDDNGIDRVNGFICYNMVYLAVLQTVINLLPFNGFEDFPILYLLAANVLNIMYKGLSYIKLPPYLLVKFAVAAVIVIVLLPFGIQQFLDVVLPNVE